MRNATELKKPKQPELVSLGSFNYYTAISCRTYIAIFESELINNIQNFMSESCELEIFIGVFYGTPESIKQQAVEIAKEKYPNICLRSNDIQLVPID